MKNRAEERKQKRANLEGFEFQMNSIKFPNIEDVFRVQLSRSPEGQVQLWMENKRTKQQFQVTIEKFSDYGPSGIPDEAVYAFLKVRALHAMLTCCTVTLRVAIFIPIESLRDDCGVAFSRKS